MHEELRVRVPDILGPAPSISRPHLVITGPPQLGPDARPLLLCFSHLRWDFVWQRPQHLLTRAAREYAVVVVEEPVVRSVPAPRLDVTTRPHGIRIAVPILPEGTGAKAAVQAQRRLLDRFIAEEGRAAQVLWYYTPMAVEFSEHLAADIVVYDNMDELSAFRGASPELLANETTLFSRADLVFTGGMSLFESKKGRHPNVFAFPSSIDVHHFAAARVAREREPADQVAITRPRLGFFGVIDERMDLDLVDRVAALKPEWQLVMLGPVVKIDPAVLPRRPNIHWLGPKTYTELPAYLAGWQVGLMPFALNEATRFISPTKTPEFLAAGLPVVSTRIKDVVRPYGEKGLVAIADSADEIVKLATQLMARPREPWLASVDRHLASGSWDSTWAAMRGAIAKVDDLPLTTASASLGDQATG